MTVLRDLTCLARQGRKTRPARERYLPLPARVFFLVHAMLAVFLPSAWAGCTGLSFSAVPASIYWLGSGGAGYGVFDAIDRVQPVTVTVSKTGGACNFFITATTLGADSFTVRRLQNAGNSLNFNLYTTATRTNILRDIPAAGPNDVLIGNFGPGGRATTSVVYYFDIPPLQVVPPSGADYEAQMQLKLFQGDLIRNTLAQSIDVRYRARVVAVTEISLIGTGEPFDPRRVSASLDLGVLTADQKKEPQKQVSLDLRVRTNSGYSLTLQSHNGGVLRINDPTDTSTVPYILTVNGVPTALSASATALIAQGTGLTGPNGVGLLINVFVNPTQVTATQATAGTYTDVITISLAAR